MGSNNVVDFRSADADGTEHTDTDLSWMLVGKLAPPHQRVSPARRDVLLTRLDESATRALSVVVSPPGFGKTTLLTQWWQLLRARDVVAAGWLTLDEGDSEVSRFAAGLILAVAGAGVDTGALEIAARRQSIDLSVGAFVAALLDVIRRQAKRLVIILDDYHRARSPAVDEVIETLIEHAQGELHLVVSGRHKPTFHVSALSARGLVSVLDAADLALTRAEAAVLIGPEVSDENLALIHSRTEGWAVALQLARLWLERGHRQPDSLREFSGRTTEMTDYLAEQILQDLGPALREFLLETSLLERFDAHLADAVRGRADSADMLEQLAYVDALLVPLDDTRDWFRYHHLFADFLCQRLQRGPAGRAATLHRRAARWLADAGDLLEAVKHAVRAGDNELAVQIMQEAGGWELILWRGIGYVRSLLKQLGDVVIRSEPVLHLTQAYLDIKLGHFDASHELLALTATSLATASPRVQRDFRIVSALRRAYVDDLSPAEWGQSIEAQVDELEPGDFLGRGTLLSVAAVAASGAGDVQRTERLSRRAIQVMRAAGSVLGTNYCFLHLAQSELLQGNLREAEALCREAMVMAEDNFGADSGLKAHSSTFLGYCLYLRGDVEECAHLVDSALTAIEASDGWVDVYAMAYEVSVRRAFVAGGIEAAMTAIARAASTGRDRKLTRLVSLAAAWRVECLATAGHVKDARREALAAKLSELAELRGPPDFTWRMRLAATMAMARLFIASGASGMALTRLAGAREDFRAANLVLPALRVEGLTILGLKQRGLEAQAVTRLESLIEFIVREGASRLVLELGAPLQSLLHHAQRRNRELILSGAQRDLIAHLLARLRQDHSGPQEGFSSRELEVLRELYHGRSNKAIGQLLDLSENTVKFHLKRVYRKLDVDCRAGAIAAALERGLLESGGSRKSRERS